MRQSRIWMAGLMVLVMAVTARRWSSKTWWEMTTTPQPDSLNDTRGAFAGSPRVAHRLRPGLLLNKRVDGFTIRSTPDVLDVT
jgi:hypothetical protein